MENTTGERLTGRDDAIPVEVSVPDAVNARDGDDVTLAVGGSGSASGQPHDCRSKMRPSATYFYGTGWRDGVE